MTARCLRSGLLLVLLGGLGLACSKEPPADPPGTARAHSGHEPARGWDGAPPFGAGPFEVRNVRVVDGDSVEATIRGARVAIRLAGLDAPEGNTACGREATSQLEALVAAGLTLSDDSAALTFDDRGRRLFHAADGGGRLVAEAMIRAGVARARAEGQHASRLAGVEAQASSARRGCVWGGPPASAPVAAARQGSVEQLAPQAFISNLPAGFSQERVTGGLTNPTAFAPLPDGRILIAEKRGTVRVFKNGALLPTPLIDIGSRVNDYWDRGLLGIAADPDFATNGHLYLLYVYENDAAAYSGTKTSRLSRFTVVGDTAATSTEAVILGTNVGRTCASFPAGSDCIPAEGFSHSVGSIRFATDGTMFVTSGDAADFNTVTDEALRAQNLDSLAGKMLRVTRTGAGLATNPFWNGTASAARSKVWAYGLRNPYRFHLRPGTGTPYAGDVGWGAYEEIDVATAGANLGWPCYEGSGRQSGYESKPLCQTLYGQGTSAVRAPLIQWGHNGTSAAATGGAFYTGTSYPVSYQGAYFFGDYSMSFLRTARVGTNEALTSGPTEFAAGADGPVDFGMGPGGDLYYLAINTGELRRLRYDAPTPATTGQLGDQAWSSATNGWGPVERNMSNGETAAGDGRTLTIGGVTYAKGLGVHALSDVRYTLSHTCTSFRAQVGLDDEVAAGSVVFQVWLDGVKAFETGVVNATMAAVPVSVDVTGKTELRLVVTDAGDGNGSDHADWADAKLDCAGGASTSYLSDRTPTSSTNGWGPAEKDTSNGESLAGDGRPLTINGSVWSKGLGVHATSDIRYALSGCSTFDAQVGIDDEVTAGSVVFQVWTDGVKAYDSGVRTGAMGAAAVNVDVRGRSELRLVVTDGGDGNASDHADWADAKVTCTDGSTGARPVATITAPAATRTYKVGDVISFSGSASDAEDGAIPGTGLAWQVIVHHCPGGVCHNHPFLSTTGASGSFTIPDHGDDSHVELLLTATDSSGQTGTASVRIHPQTVQLTLATSPAGLQVIYGGTTYTAPRTFTTVVGSSHTITAPSPQTLNGTAHTFSSWSDGGAAQHTITVGSTNSTLTASFSATPPPEGIAAPSGLGASAGGSTKNPSIALRWVDNSTNEAKFIIERSTSSAFTANLVTREAAANATTFTDKPLATRTTYYYRVYAATSDGRRSTASNVASATTK